MTQARDVELQTYINPSLLGGMVVEVGSQFIDASVRGQLRRLAFSMQVA
jgi:F-type H+-transporting ATPase subunit delta